MARNYNTRRRRGSSDWKDVAEITVDREDPMLCLEVSVNGERLCTAGVGDEGVLNAIISWVGRGHAEDCDNAGKTPADLHVGGLANNTHLRWLDGFQKLKLGDVVTVRIVDLPSADPPLREEPSLPPADGTVPRLDQPGFALTTIRRQTDDGRRGPKGVLLSIRRGDGEIELTVDDVALDHPTSCADSQNRLWRHDWFTTFLRLPLEMGENTFSQDKLAEFGLTILGCIYGLASGVPPEDSQNGEPSSGAA